MRRIRIVIPSPLIVRGAISYKNVNVVLNVYSPEQMNVEGKRQSIRYVIS